MTRKSTIAKNWERPQDAVIPARAAEPQEPRQDKRRFTFHLPVDLMDRAKNVAYWERLTMTGWFTDAITAAIERFEKKRGEPYPKRKAEPKAGRPIG